MSSDQVVLVNDGESAIHGLYSYSEPDIFTLTSLQQLHNVTDKVLVGDMESHRCVSDNTLRSLYDESDASYYVDKNVKTEMKFYDPSLELMVCTPYYHTPENKSQHLNGIVHELGSPYRYPIHEDKFLPYS
ncbi:unnamed protein product [Timema podura]|uniref:Uncharacterized protein n=1 Tax=Timema podura TaxID=61482 RepID=A0ABN7NUT1_TIMPD|nr:unnamed protein product [Timema podura]